MHENRIIKQFFLYIALSMLVSALKINLQGLSDYEVVVLMFKYCAFNFISGVFFWFGTLCIDFIYKIFKK